MFISLNVFAQEGAKKKIEKVGDLFEVTTYYENGQVLQHGFLSKNNKLHASWESYYKDGSRKCVAIYDNGVKVGTWYYYNKGIKTKVIYNNNKIISIDTIQK